MQYSNIIIWTTKRLEKIKLTIVNMFICYLYTPIYTNKVHKQ